MDEMLQKKIKETFDPIHAQEDLKQTARNHIQNYKAKGRYSSIHRKYRPLIAICSLTLFLVCGLGGYGVYNTEAAVVSIDVEPSIELRLNSLGMVIGQKAYGAEGEQILSDLNLTNMSYTKALNLLLMDQEMGTYLKEGTTLMVTVETDEKKQQQILDQVQSSVNLTLNEHHPQVNASYGCANREERDAAHHQGVSMGKYKVLQELLEEEPTADITQLKEQSVGEIRSYIEHCRESKGNGQNQGEGQGQGQEQGQGQGRGKGHRHGQAGNQNSNCSEDSCP